MNAMKKIFALLCAALLLAVSCACADSGTVVEFRDNILLNGTLPEGYHFALKSQTDLTLEGEIVSDDAAAPVLEVYIAFNESYAQAESLKNLDDDTMNRIKLAFSEEDSVTFELFDTASGDAMLLIREAGGQFLDFYTICLGYEIELTVFPAPGQALTDAQISEFTEIIRNMDIVPVRG